MAKRGSASKGSDLKPPPQTWLNRYRREAGYNVPALEQRAVASAHGASAG